MVLIRRHRARVEVRGVRGPYELHRLLWRAFDGDQRAFLFRADPGGDEGLRRSVVLVESDSAGNWSALGDDLLAAATKVVDLRLSAGQGLRFLLRANPTVARKGRREPATASLEGDAFRATRGHRVALHGDEERLGWLERQGASHGFAVARVAGAGEEGLLVDSRAVRLLRPSATGWQRGGHEARYDGVDFEGRLTIADPEKFGAAIRRGIGPGKAFGFGLLSLAAT